MEKVLKNYINASNEPYKNHPIANLIRKDIPDFFKREIGSDFQIKGSAGIGRWALVPWISFINEKITITPQEGYYVVYLFKEDMSGFYLSLNFGAREFIRNYGRQNLNKAAVMFREILQDKFYDVKNYSPMDLGCRDGNKKGYRTINYEKGDIFSIEYRIDDLPSDDELIEDLIFILKLYDYLYKVRRNTIFSDEELKLFNIEPQILIFESEKLEDSISLNIKNYGVISNANLKISKINIIGGKNATGKSTASKILYCFLKYNSSYRQNLAYKTVIDEIERLYVEISRLSIKNNFKRWLRSNAQFFHTNYIYEQLEQYEDFKEFFYSNVYDSKTYDPSINEIFKRIDKIDELIDTVEYGGNKLFSSIIRTLLKSEVPIDNNGFIEFKGNYNNQKFNFSSNQNKFDSIGEFFINDVIYIDSISFLDIDDPEGLTSSNHVESLKEAIQPYSDDSKKFLDDFINSDIDRILYELKVLISGEFDYSQGKLVYIDEDNNQYSMNNTASGIKQIGIIQLLLRYRKLKRNSVLIIDEPEVNLHPGWQFKFAEILVFLVRKLDIKLYINTHSPIFIEAIEVFSMYYNLENETNFYLTQESDVNGKYDFVKCGYNNLHEIYTNLAEPFDIINVYRYKSEYKQNNKLR